MFCISRGEHYAMLYLLMTDYINMLEKRVNESFRNLYSRQKAGLLKIRILTKTRDYQKMGISFSIRGKYWSLMKSLMSCYALRPVTFLDVPEKLENEMRFGMTDG